MPNPLFCLTGSKQRLLDITKHILFLFFHTEWEIVYSDPAPVYYQRLRGNWALCLYVRRLYAFSYICYFKIQVNNQTEANDYRDRTIAIKNGHTSFSVKAEYVHYLSKITYQQFAHNTGTYQNRLKRIS